MSKSLSAIVRDRIEKDPRSIYAIAKDSGLPQSSLHRFASGERDLTGAKLGILIANLGGQVLWKKFPKKSG